MRRISVIGAVAALALGVSLAPARAADFDTTVHLLKDIHPGTDDSGIVKTNPVTSNQPTNPVPNLARSGVALGSRVVFGAFNGTTDTVWVSSGTAAGTVPLTTTAQDPAQFTAFGGRVYFTAHTSDGTELWRTDGTSAGTTEVANLNTASGANSNPFDLTVVGSYLYFAATPVSGGAEQLFRYQAPPAIGPAQPPVQITSFAGTAGIEYVSAFGSRVVFSSTADGHGSEPWISDGTAAGTVLLKDIESGSAGSSPAWFTTMGAEDYFAADSAAGGVELWRTDGTSAGTAQVADLYTGVGGSVPTDLFAYNGHLLFRAESTSGFALWTTDGTSVGTHSLAALNGVDTGNVRPGWTLYNGYVYFSAGTPALGSNLYRTKGVPGDVTMVKDLNPGTSNGSPQGFRVVDGELYFTAQDAAHGFELWRSNGTASGTAMLKDIDPGTASSNPAMVGVLGNTILFSAGDPTHGKELWVYTAQSTALRGYPKARYTKKLAKQKKIKVLLRATAGSTVPTGKVILKKGARTIGSGTLSGGKVTIRITIKLPKGKSRVRAYYTGNVHNSTTSSSSFVIKVR